MHREYDLVISGGGMVGASLAVALAGTDLRIAIVEAVAPAAEQQPSYDDRGLALSLSSCRILDALGIWEQLEASASPIRRVHVSDQGHFGKVRMDAAALGLDALGYVVIARELGRVLRHTLDRSESVDMYCPARIDKLQHGEDHVELGLAGSDTAGPLRSRLLVVADGTHSSVREQLGIAGSLRDYGQTAIVCNLGTENPHGDTAYERFTRNGPLAFLPLRGNRGVMVRGVTAKEAEYFLGLDDDPYLEVLQQAFGPRLGRLERPGKRSAYPIVQLQVENQCRERAVVLGNAAHTLHPNGAQGFNLCLRDVAGLSEQLIAAQRAGEDIGSRFLLDAYAFSRKADQGRTSELSHGLTEWFYSSNIVRAAVRNSAMTFIDLFPAVKNGVIKRGMGLSGRQPAVVRGRAQ